MEAYLKSKHRRCACNLVEWGDTLVRYLKRHGVKFENAMPVIPLEMLVKAVPNEAKMLPSSKRSATKTPSKDILCNFEGDGYLYCHVRNIVKAVQKGYDAVERVISPYRKFFAVAGFDLTITPGMDQCEQDMIFLLNWLLDATLAINGVHIIPNFRVGNERQAEKLAIFPKGLCYAIGRIGEERNVPHLDEYLTRIRVMFARPGKFLVYGYRKSSPMPLLEELGVAYECFEDYRHASYGLKKGVV